MSRPKKDRAMVSGAAHIEQTAPRRAKSVWPEPTHPDDSVNFSIPPAVSDAINAVVADMKVDGGVA